MSIIKQKKPGFENTTSPFSGKVSRVLFRHLSNNALEIPINEILILSQFVDYDEETGLSLSVIRSPCDNDNENRVRVVMVSGERFPYGSESIMVQWNDIGHSAAVTILPTKYHSGEVQHDADITPPWILNLKTAT